MSWRFFDYVERSGANPYALWHAGLEEDAQAIVDARIGTMEGQQTWPPKWTSDMKGRDKIFEIRITWNKMQFRPMAMFAPTVRRGVVLLGGGIEKSGKLPPGLLDAVEARRDTLLSDPNRMIPHV